MITAARATGLLALVVAAACTSKTERRDAGIVLFVSDFGTRDGAVAACKGVMWGVDPSLRVVDLTHDVPPYDIETAAEVLEQALPFYPSGTVAVAVVDPGVGSERKAIAIQTKKGHVLVGPDNGIFTLVVQTEGLERAVELRNARYFRLPRASSTFHGRDIFAPVAAHLASGVPLDSLGPPIVPVRLDLQVARMAEGRIEGTVRYIEDPYGNVVTNIPPALLDSLGARVGDSLHVRFGSTSLRLPWRNTFSDVPPGRPLALLHSRGVLSFSINQGDFARVYGVERKGAVSIRK
ncbi:MAG TPA: S-adenosyl-l-methionine hydroxide adenosyltransferase family protein [Gemmatimonadaceae bacterium]|nr:S-adenosyl-l-methionine hydroxide adenosyltransferase family protein [Gemmatimonadaceae bacterium]